MWSMGILLIFLTLNVPVQADTIILDAIDRGWYANDGGHNPDNLNYFVGNSTSGFLLRNFFVFDLSGINQPIVSAELHLGNTTFFSNDPTETYTLFDVITNLTDLINGGPAEISTYLDLGSGSVYGSHLASFADNDTFIVIPLNKAALGSLVETNGLWAVGGAITTLDNDPTTTERLFGGSSEDSTLSSTRLVLCISPGPCPPPCPADITPAGGNGVVNIDDLVAVLNGFGPCPGSNGSPDPPGPCPSDMSPAWGDGFVTINEIIAIIDNFGPCPAG